ncbi:NUDIX hydrolase [Neisseria musculi]|uniref:NUDIX domain protein n=1 Tax=Neisseria musculi TaxID=1815583 RepID=A0A7H1M941_9NEIS|nr:CoA pyrophosphatase [Neisseria musculi]QNT58156.1 NUDIX domain protein [Neisseria musculi]
MPPAELTRFFRRAAAYPSATRNLRNALIDGIEVHEAAVLLAVVFRKRQWQVLLTRRAATLPHHPGQVAFAGGRRDEGDIDLTHTALRETAEETGIAAGYWQTFEPLPPYFTPSGYTVSPVPALSITNPPVYPNIEEVEEIFYLPLDLALDKSLYRSRNFSHNGQTVPTPFLPYLHYDIWGMTAMILYDLAERYELHKGQR